MRTTHITPTAIRHAFNNIRVMPSAYKATGDDKPAAIISDALRSKAGMNAELDWNAKLSMKTAQALDAPNYNPVVKQDDGTVKSLFKARAMSTGTYGRMVS